MKRILLSITAISILSLTLNSCKKDNAPSNELKKAAISNYATIVSANYSDALAKAEILKTNIDLFVATPTQSNLDAAKTAWLEARLPYGQTEVYRFYGGPIDNANDGPEGLLNAWPMDEAFIDYVNGAPTAGKINDLLNFPIINKQTIEAQNENGGETNVSCGFHAIEFLLWGQDLSTTSAGVRPFTDYITIGGTALNQGRRGDYLKACAELLVEHLQKVASEWSVSTGNYRSSFVNDDADASLIKIIQGMGFLAKGELAGERLEVAYDTQLQEDEHSCFSDNTHNDMRMNALAISNVFNGTYTTTSGTIISGTSIYDVVKAKDPTLADAAKTAIQQAKDNVYLILAPFDQQIISTNTTGRETMRVSIQALKNAGDEIAKAANTLGLTIIVE